MDALFLLLLILKDGQPFFLLFLIVGLLLLASHTPATIVELLPPSAPSKLSGICGLGSWFSLEERPGHGQPRTRTTGGSLGAADHQRGVVGRGKEHGGTMKRGKQRVGYYNVNKKKQSNHKGKRGGGR